jgi:hypothetical protein
MGFYIDCYLNGCITCTRIALSSGQILIHHLALLFVCIAVIKLLAAALEPSHRRCNRSETELESKQNHPKARALAAPQVVLKFVP